MKRNLNKYIFLLLIFFCSSVSAQLETKQEEAVPLYGELDRFRIDIVRYSALVSAKIDPSEHALAPDRLLSDFFDAKERAFGAQNKPLKNTNKELLWAIMETQLILLAESNKGKRGIAVSHLIEFANGIEIDNIAACLELARLSSHFNIDGERYIAFASKLIAPFFKALGPEDRRSVYEGMLALGAIDLAASVVSLSQVDEQSAWYLARVAEERYRAYDAGLMGWPSKEQQNMIRELASTAARQYEHAIEAEPDPNRKLEYAYAWSKLLIGWRYDADSKALRDILVKDFIRYRRSSSKELEQLLGPPGSKSHIFAKKMREHMLAMIDEVNLKRKSPLPPSATRAIDPLIATTLACLGDSFQQEKSHLIAESVCEFWRQWYVGVDLPAESAPATFDLYLWNAVHTPLLTTSSRQIVEEQYEGWMAVYSAIMSTNKEMPVYVSDLIQEERDVIKKNFDYTRKYVLLHCFIAPTIDKDYISSLSKLKNELEPVSDLLTPVIEQTRQFEKGEIPQELSHRLDEILYIMRSVLFTAMTDSQRPTKVMTQPGIMYKGSTSTFNYEGGFIYIVSSPKKWKPYPWKRRLDPH